MRQACMQGGGKYSSLTSELEGVAWRSASGPWRVTSELEGGACRSASGTCRVTLAVFGLLTGWGLDAV